jgi:hypothetical protein
MKEPIIMVRDAVKSVERKALKKSKLFLGFCALVKQTNVVHKNGFHGIRDEA